MKFTFLSSFFARIFSRVKSNAIKPLITHKDDMALLTHLHGKKMPKKRQLRYLIKVLSETEKRIVYGCIFLIVFGCLWFGFRTSSNYRVAIPAVGGAYTEAVVGSLQFVNPLFASVNDADVDVTRLVYSGLIRYGKNQSYVPDLAAEYTISEDKKTYIISLRKDVFWHDGEPFTARDVEFTFGLLQDPQVNSPLLFSFQNATFEFIDEYTVQFTLPEPYEPFLTSLAVGILPEHIWSTIPVEQLRLTNTNLRPVGTGPFMFEELAKDETGFVFRYALKRFEKYYDEPAFIESFVFRFFAEYESDLGAIHALRQQKVDGVHFIPSHLREQVKRKHIVIHTLQLPQYTALFINQKGNAVLQKENTRTALAYALDKERILRESLNNEGEVIYSPILRGSIGFTEDVEKTPYSVEQANELLDKHFAKVSYDEYKEERKKSIEKELSEEKAEEIALQSQENPEEAVSQDDTATTTSTLESVVSEEEKAQEEVVNQEVERRLQEELTESQLFFRKDKEGNVVTINLVTADTEQYRKTAERIAGFWQELGVVTEISYVDPKEITRKVLKKKEYDILLYGIILGSDPDQYPFWHSSQIPYPGLNLAQYQNRTVDGHLEKIRTEADEEKKNALYKKFQDVLTKERPAIFLYTPTYTHATSDVVHGIQTKRIFHPADRFADVTRWYIKTKGEWQFSKVSKQ